MADQTQTERQRISVWKLALIATGLICLTFIALAFLLPQRPSRIERVIEARLAELRARGVPLTASEVARALPDPSPEHDAHKVLAKAFSLVMPEGAPAGLPIVGGAELPERGVPIPEPMMRLMSNHLANAGAVMDAIPERLEEVRFAMGWNSGCTNPPIRFPLIEMRALMQTLALKVIYEAERGDAQAASAALRKGFDLTLAVNDDTFTTTIIRGACAGLMCETAEQALSRAAFDTATLLDLERRIRPELIGNFERALIGERYVGLLRLDEFKRLHKGHRTVQDLFHRLQRIFGRGELPPYRDEDCILFLDSMDARTAMQSLPLLERLRVNQRIETEHWSKVRSVAGESMPTPGGKSHVVAFEARARLSALQAALAIERYRGSTRQVPARLADLATHYLVSIPKDPFDDQPVRYKRLDRGYMVWSVGADGVDDNGAVRTNYSATNMYDVTIVVER